MFTLQLTMKLALLMAVVLLVNVRNGEQAIMSCPESKYSKQMILQQMAKQLFTRLLYSGTKREGVLSKYLPSADVI